MQKKENLVLYIIVAIVLAFLVLGVILIRSGKLSDMGIVNKPVSKLPLVVPTPAMLGEDGVDLAHLLSWFDSQRSKIGVYYWQEVNASNNKVEYGIESPWASFPVIMARYYYWKNFGDDSQLVKIEADLDGLYKFANLGKSFQSNVWNCKTMFLLTQDNKVPENIKDKAKYTCEIGLSWIDEISPDSSIERFKGDYNPTFRSSYQELFTTRGGAKPNGSHMSLDEVSLGIKSSYVSDLLAHYLVLGGDKFVKYSQGALEAALNRLALLRENEYVSGSCTLAVGALDLYEFTKENKYLDLYLALEKDQGIRDCGGKNDACRASLYDKAMCGLAMVKASRLTGEDRKAEIDKIRKSIATENYSEVAQGAAKVKGKKIFFQRYIIEGNKADIITNVRDNALGMIFLLEANNLTKVQNE